MPPPLSLAFLLGPTGRIRTGGAACALEYAKRFQQLGHDVSISTWPRFLWPEEHPFPDLDFEVDIFFDSAPTKEYLPYHLLNRTPRDFIGEYQFFAAYMNLLTPAIPKCDLIIANNWDSILPAWQSKQGKPVHFPQHYDEVFYSLDATPEIGFQGNPLIKLLCRNSFQFPIYRIANSSWLSAEFARRFDEQVPFVNHGINCSMFQLRPKKSLADGVLRVVTYSRPEKWKGFPEAVAAMQEAKARFGERLEWHVYGFENKALPPDNPWAPYFFHGKLGHETLSKLYAESDVVLCPSWYESFPLPPIEAMACGTAVITTPYGTEDYAMQGKTALVVPPRVTSAMADAIEQVLRDADLRGRLAANGRKMAESLTWDRAVKAREQLLYQIHENRWANDLIHGFDTAIPDGRGICFERIPADLMLEEGELLGAEDGTTYLVESKRLRRISDAAALGLEAVPDRTIDMLTLARVDFGPEIHSRADLFLVRPDQAASDSA